VEGNFLHFPYLPVERMDYHVSSQFDQVYCLWIDKHHYGHQPEVSHLTLFPEMQLYVPGYALILAQR
jgi:hypothetical protein